MADANGGKGRKPMNGSGPIRVLAPAVAMPVPYDDPLTKVFGLDAQSSGVLPWVGYFLGAFAFLLGLAVTARAMTVIFAAHGPPPVPPAPQEIDIMAPEAPPPPPPAPPAPEPEVKNEPPPTPHPAPHEATPPPAPAQAGKVLTQEPDPNEPVDLTGNTIISGNADSFAGGVTAANGTSKTAVRGLTSPNGAPAAAAAPPAAVVPGPDRSRPPSMADPSVWLNAPFPREADDAQIDNAAVTIRVHVRPDGTIEVPTVIKDPGYGFGREVLKQALRIKYLPALDHDGHPIDGTFTTIVRYSR